MDSILVLIAVVGLTFGPVSSAPTCSQVSDMSAVILDAMYSPHSSASANLHSLALRLGFHDCVGGCNGCINFNNGDNAGLQVGVDNLTTLYYDNGYDAVVSLADFYALATTVSVRSGVQQSNTERSGADSSPCPVPCFTMKWGRVDAADCSNDNSELPSPTMTGDEMFDYFKSEFGFSKDQVVALMGAHSFGAAFPENSGYSGKWTSKHHHGLNELYYSYMINPEIVYTNLDISTTSSVHKYEFKGKWTTNGTTAGFMLNTDFELFYNLTLDSNAKLTCTLNNVCGLTDSCDNYCPTSSTFSTAHTYAQDCSAFMTDFVDVISLMLVNGYDDGDLETTDCSCS